MRRITLLTAILAVLCSCTLLAQTNARPAAPKVEPIPEMQRASVDEVKALFVSMQIKEQVETMLNAMRTQMTANFDAQMKRMNPPMSNKALSEVRAAMDEGINLVKVEDMLNDMVPLYQKYITRDEMASIRAFYESPAGKSLLAKSPVITQEFMSTAMPKEMEKMNAYMAKMQSRIQKIMEEDATANKN